MRDIFTRVGALINIFFPGVVRARWTLIRIVFVAPLFGTMDDCILFTIRIEYMYSFFFTYYSVNIPFWEYCKNSTHYLFSNKYLIVCKISIYDTALVYDSFNSVDWESFESRVKMWSFMVRNVVRDNNDRSLAVDTTTSSIVSDLLLSILLITPLLRFFPSNLSHNLCSAWKRKMFSMRNVGDHIDKILF